MSLQKILLYAKIYLYSVNTYWRIKKNVTVMWKESMTVLKRLGGVLKCYHRWIHLFTIVDYFEGYQGQIVKTISTLKWHFEYLLVPTATWWVFKWRKLHRLMTQCGISIYSTTDDDLISDAMTLFAFVAQEKGPKGQRTDTHTRDKL